MLVIVLRSLAIFKTSFRIAEDLSNEDPRREASCRPRRERIPRLWGKVCSRARDFEEKKTPNILILQSETFILEIMWEVVSIY